MASNPANKPTGTKTRIKKTQTKKSSLPFTKENYIIFFIGLFIILTGYIFMGTGDLNGPVSLTLSPILLTVGYLVLIPLAILYRKKDAVEQSQS